ncbi:MAG: hypothetical protein JWO19_3802, partial [Bryobacterales bacterium]|nr:hypothetical protein [Bryobacterales bacterium]
MTKDPMQSEGFDETSVSILLAAVCGAGSSTLDKPVS